MNFSSTTRKGLTVTLPGEPCFACDAMLGSLTRWLRVAGFDACWHEGIDDWDLIRMAKAEGRILLSCDTGIFRVGIVRDGEVSAVQVPNGLKTAEQLAFVLTRLKLSPRRPRCMACGGELAEVPKEAMAARVPARSFAWLERFWQCVRCGKPFWQGTHWPRIAAVLERLEQDSRPPDELRSEEM
jgi:uncharacterized protein with PIN domain